MRAVTANLSRSFLRSTRSELSRKYLLLLPSILVLMIAPLFLLDRSNTSAYEPEARQGVTVQARLSEAISVKASGRGNPHINLSDGRDVITAYDGPAEIVEALEQNRAKPLSLASADFDEDGVPDLVSGYAGPDGGIIILHRGNVDHIYPNTPEAKRRKAAGTFTESPFLSPAQVFPAPEKADFIGAGDFDADGHWDVAVANLGGESLYLLKGDGQGQLGAAEEVFLPGRVTAFTTGETNRQDGLSDIVVCVASEQGPRALVFEGTEGSLRVKPEEIALPDQASSVALARLDGDPYIDLAVGAGHNLVIVSGRDRRRSSGEVEHAGASLPSVETISLSFRITSLGTGDFDGRHEAEVAILSDVGDIHMLSSRATSNKISNEKITARGLSAGVTRLIPARVTSLPKEGLLALDTAGQTMQILASDSEGEAMPDSQWHISAVLDTEAGPVAALPMRLNADALCDIVVLSAGKVSPSVIETAPTATFTVTNTNSFGEGSLRQAILNANGNPGADLITFSIGSGPQTITLTSFGLVQITDPVTIDGTTQPGFAGSPLIKLDGINMIVSLPVLDIIAGNTVVRGLIVIERMNNFAIALGTNGNNLIQGNYIGTDLNGTVAPAITIGIFINSSNNIIGGTTPDARNIISGNGVGIQISLASSTGNKIQGNFIGTNAGGTAAVANGEGVVLANQPFGNTIGGATVGARNIISGNGRGINIQGQATTNLIQGNFIGTNASGTGCVPNGEGIGILFDASNNTIIQNLISCNTRDGVSVTSAGTTNNSIRANLIGTDVTGTLDRGNGQDGVNITRAPGTVVGGSQNGDRNIISGNDRYGVSIGIFNSTSGQTGGTGITVQNNFIGTKIDGISALGNSLDGVFVDADSLTNVIDGNTIAFNGSNGLRIPGVASNAGLEIRITNNSIHSNSSLGIDLGPAGITPNDPLDPDRGANLLQNKPVLTSATSVAPLVFDASILRPHTTGTIRIVGVLNGLPNTDFFVQFFSAAQCTNSNPGGDQQALNFLPILFRTDLNGNAPIDVTFENATIVGSWVNALARDPRSNTSEFSQCIQVNTASSCSFSIGPAGQTFSSGGGTGSVAVTAGSGCVWTAVSNDSFITITAGPDGTGNGAVGYQVAANPGSSQRTGTMTIAGQTFTVTQQAAPAPCTFSINPTSQNFTAAGGSGSFSVTTQGGCNWTPLTDVGWVTATRSGSTVNFLVESNSSAQREGHIIVQDQVFTVNQNGAAVVCTYSITPAQADFPAGGGNGSFTLTTGQSCSWNAAANVPWITVSISGVGGGQINYTVEANSGPPRIGQIFVEGQQITVDQAASCAFSLSETHKSFAANGGTGSLTVTTGVGCVWTATSNNPGFITITSGDIASGSDTVTYSVAVNTGPATRSGTITVGGQTYTVYQGVQFADVAVSHPFYSEIGRLSARQVTLGCSTTNYCPNDVVTRQQMAAFIIRALGNFNPPQPPNQRFLDVPPANPFYAFIEQMAIRQITLGCGGGNYCPTDPVLRDQMAAFMIRALHAPGYIPPQPAQQRFLDVLPTNPFYAHIEEMAVRQITLGCGGGNYCPTLAVTRGQMAAFLVRAFNL